MNNSSELNEYIQQAVAKYSSNIIRIAFTYVKNIPDAEDILQDTFLSFLQAKPIFESEEHEKAWFMFLRYNYLIKKRKARKHMVSLGFLLLSKTFITIGRDYFTYIYKKFTSYS